MRIFLAIMSLIGGAAIVMLGPEGILADPGREFVFPIPGDAGWLLGFGACAGYLLWWGMSFLFGRPTLALLVTYCLVLTVLHFGFGSSLDFFDVGCAFSLLVHVLVSKIEDLNTQVVNT